MVWQLQPLHRNSPCFKIKTSLPSSFSSSYRASGLVLSVESRCGAVAVGAAYLFPPLSSGGASIAGPSLRFHILLIEPDMQISRIRLSDKTAYLCTRKVIRSSPDNSTGPCCPGVHRPVVLHITAHATTWVVIDFPNRNPGSSFTSACGTFRGACTQFRSFIGLPQSPMRCHFQHPP